MNTLRGRLDSARTSPSPEIECWVPDRDPSGVGVLIFPGGGYRGLAAHEGEGYARFLCRAGIACFIVKYRRCSEGYHHPAMLEDALAAMYAVRSHSAAFGVDPAKLGVMGSSAGGHLAAHTLVGWPRYESAIPLRPDFGILCYPVVVSDGPHAHKGSIRNLAGENPSPELLAELSCDTHVSGKTPPCFLWHTGEDVTVPLENSVVFAAALRKHGVPFELHLYHKGGHGLGLGASFDWSRACLRWIEETVRPNVPLRRDSG